MIINIQKTLHVPAEDGLQKLAVKNFFPDVYASTKKKKVTFVVQHHNEALLSVIVFVCNAVPYAF